MKVIDDSAPCLLYLLLLAELFVHASPRPAPSHAPSHALCRTFKSLFHQVDLLMGQSRKLHDLSDEEALDFHTGEHRLDSLPHLPHSAEYFKSLKVNESLSQLYRHAQSFMEHVDWLKTAKENASVSSQSAEGSGVHLLQISKLLNASLHEINTDVPQWPSPSLPVDPSGFDVLRISVEISDHLEMFCDMSKRVLRYLLRTNRCPKH